MLYYLANHVDPDFRELFKVAADFEEKVNRTQGNVHLYAQLMATLVKKENLLPLTKEAVAAALDQTVRLSGDASKLSTHMRGVTDLLCEADYCARQAGRQAVEHSDIDKAIDEQAYRLCRLRDQMYEHVERDLLMLSVDGRQTGQINALSVMAVGDDQFGHPTRITATARLGGGEVLDIQREVDMAGAAHSKGVLIMTGYVKGRYLTTKPLSLNASLVFEQTYGVIDGDSASLAELCVLLSAISQIPIYQNFAVTGSVSQLGYVQPIGGVNEKIEGFYDICQRKGLTGTQGVLIPVANQQHLMLRQDVAQAVHDGQFFIYPVATVDEALSLLTGLKAGERDDNDCFPKGSANHLIEHRLEQMADWAKTQRLSADNANE
jgi:predicted ATP-dependent protease